MSSEAFTLSVTWGSPARAAVRIRSTRAANRERGVPGFEPPGRFAGRSDSRSDTCLLPEPLLRCGKSTWGDVATLSVYLSSREARSSPGPREEGLDQLTAAAGSEADQTPSALQLRLRMLEMSPVFGELADGPLRALARRMRVVGLPSGDKLQLGTEHGDAVVFLASGLVDQILTDASGRVLLTRRRLPGEMVILPVQRTGDRFVTSIDGLSNAVLLTLDRDSLVQGLGAEVEKVAVALDQLWAQEVAAMEAAAVQIESRAAAPIVAFFSAKGGSGATTLAVNTAAALARTYPRQVLLVDLSAPFGHAALFSDL